MKVKMHTENSEEQIPLKTKWQVKKQISEVSFNQTSLRSHAESISGGPL